MVFYQVMGERMPDPFEQWAEAIKGYETADVETD